MSKGNSDLYDWKSCKSIDDVAVSTGKMAEFAKVFTSGFEKKKDIIIKLIKDGKKAEVVIKAFMKKITDEGKSFEEK